MQSIHRAIKRGNAARRTEPRFDSIGLPTWELKDVIFKKGSPKKGRNKYFK